VLLTREDRIPAIKDAFYRSLHPNVNKLLMTAVTFCLVVYFHGFRIVLPLHFAAMRGRQTEYPIKFLYTSNTPIISVVALIINVCLFSQAFSNCYPGFLSAVLGSWQSGDLEAKVPTGGIA